MSARYEISEGELDVLAITGPEGTRYIDGEEIEARVIRQQSADIASLRAELAAVVAERDRLRDAMADKIAHESYITGLTAGPSGLVMGMEGDGPRLLSAAFVAMYRDCGAVNYLEMTIQDPANGERFAVTVQRVEGKTPNQLRRDAEAERDHLRARLAAIDAAPSADLGIYDAGQMSGYGGGNVEWWWNYIRAELGRAHDFYTEQSHGLITRPAKD